MNEEYIKLKEDVRKIVKECPWGKEQTLETHSKELKKEVEELIEALKKDDKVNLKEELGDIFYDSLFLLLIAEKSNKVDIEETIKNVREKVRRRSPHIFGDVKAETREEVDKNWHEIKKKEKELMYSVPNK